MALIDLVYLASGIAIGISSQWLLRPAKKQEQRDDIKQDIPILKAPLQESTASLEPDLDLSSLKAQLQQTQLAYQMASEMSSFKGGFLSRTSHELRSPLSSMIGLHQLILSDLCENQAEEREFVAQAHASALKLVKLIDEIVAVAKTEHGTTSMEIQSLPLHEVLAEVYNLTHLQAANRSLRLSLSPPDPEIYISADQRQLRQVLVNLVDTAITFMQEGSIHVSAQSSPASGYAYIWIDADCPEVVWSEPLDLLETEPEFGDSQTEKAAKLSPGLNILVNQILAERMAGRLEVMTVPSDKASGSSAATNSTRLQCSIPLASSTELA